MPAAFPFSAIVGQAEMKLALTLTAIDPSIGGVLVFGDRGTGKSTAVRSLAALLPPIEIARGSAYNAAPLNGEDRETVPTPVIDLPLGATEDRVVGALDLERALTRGEKAFEPGLLARAHRGFLYIDEVNLLEDHIVDLLLDVAASGENVVEREGLSVRHAARFVLVGSGNPEEGELRPQLLDRFGLSVEVSSPREIAERVEVIRRRDAFDRAPDAFLRKWAAADARHRRAILAARRRLPRVATPDATLAACAGALHRARRRRPARRAHADARRPRARSARSRAGGDARAPARHRAPGAAPPPAPRPARRGGLERAGRAGAGRGHPGVSDAGAGLGGCGAGRGAAGRGPRARRRLPARAQRTGAVRLACALPHARPGPRGRSACRRASATSRLFGGLDLAATLAAGRPVVSPGLLAAGRGARADPADGRARRRRPRGPARRRARRRRTASP